MSALQDAEELIHAGDSRQAIELLDENQQDPNCTVRLRELLIGEGLYEYAMPVLQRQASEQSVEGIVARSALSLLQGNVQEALAACSKAAGLDESNPGIHNHAGRALHNAGQPDRALQAFRRAIDLHPGYSEAWHNTGHVLRASGRLVDAAEAYKKALGLAPGYRSARLNLGKTLFNIERIEDALVEFERILTTYDEDVEALTDAGLALHLLGDHSKSQSYYERAIASDSQFTQAWVYLAILLNEIQDADGAIRALEKALQIEPENVDQD